MPYKQAGDENWTKLDERQESQLSSIWNDGSIVSGYCGAPKKSRTDTSISLSMTFFSLALSIHDFAGELVEVEMFWGYPRLKAVVDVPHLNREQVVNKLSKVCGCHLLCHCVSEGMCFGSVLDGFCCTLRFGCLSTPGPLRCFDKWHLLPAAKLQGFGHIPWKHNYSKQHKTTELCLLCPLGPLSSDRCSFTQNRRWY